MSTLVEYQDRKKIFKTKCLSELKSQIGEWLYEICGDSAWMLELWDESWGEWLEVDDNQVLGDKNRVRVRPLTVFSAASAVTGVDAMMVLDPAGPVMVPSTSAPVSSENAEGLVDMLRQLPEPAVTSRLGVRRPGLGVSPAEHTGSGRPDLPLSVQFDTRCLRKGLQRRLTSDTPSAFSPTDWSELGDMVFQLQSPVDPWPSDRRYDELTSALLERFPNLGDGMTARGAHNYIKTKLANRFQAKLLSLRDMELQVQEIQPKQEPDPEISEITELQQRPERAEPTDPMSDRFDSSETRRIRFDISRLPGQLVRKLTSCDRVKLDRGEWREVTDMVFALQSRIDKKPSKARYDQLTSALLELFPSLAAGMVHHQAFALARAKIKTKFQNNRRTKKKKVCETTGMLQTPTEVEGLGRGPPLPTDNQGTSTGPAVTTRENYEQWKKWELGAALQSYGLLLEQRLEDTERFAAVQKMLAERGSTKNLRQVMWKLRAMRSKYQEVREGEDEDASLPHKLVHLWPLMVRVFGEARPLSPSLMEGVDVDLLPASDLDSSRMTASPLPPASPHQESSIATPPASPPGSPGASPPASPLAPTPEPPATTPEPSTSSAQARAPTPETRALTPEPQMSSLQQRAPTPQPRSPAPEPGSPAPEPSSKVPEPSSPAPEPGSPVPEPGSPAPQQPSPVPAPRSPALAERAASAVDSSSEGGTHRPDPEGRQVEAVRAASAEQGVDPGPRGGDVSPEQSVNPHSEEEPPAGADRHGDRPEPAPWDRAHPLHPWTASDARRLVSVEQKLELLLNYNRHIKRQLAVLSEAARDTRRATADVRTVAGSINDTVTLTAERLVNLPTAGFTAGDGSDIELMSAASRTAAGRRHARRNRSELSAVARAALFGSGPAAFGPGPPRKRRREQSTEHHEEPALVYESAAGGDAAVSRPDAQAPAQEVLHSGPIITHRGNQAQINPPRRESLQDGDIGMNNTASKVLPGHSRAPAMPVRVAASWKFQDVTPKIVGSDAGEDIQEIPAQETVPKRYDTACDEAQSLLDERALAEFGVRLWRLQRVTPANDAGGAAGAPSDSGGVQRSGGPGRTTPGTGSHQGRADPGGTLGALSRRLMSSASHEKAGGGFSGTVTQRLRQCRRDSLLSGAGDGAGGGTQPTSAARQAYQSAAPAGREDSEGAGMLNAVIDWESDTEPPNELTESSNGSFGREIVIPEDPLELDSVERAAARRTALREAFKLDEFKVEIDDT